MIRFYLVPVEINPIFINTHRGPKYFQWPYDPDPPSLLNVLWQGRDYGNEPLMLVAADISDTDDVTLTAMPDVIKFADDLDTPMGVRLTTMQTALELLNLPAQMLTVNTKDRLVIRGIMAIFLVAQCMQGKGFRIFNAGVTLTTTMGSLSVAARQALQDCATTFNYDITGITLASTVREVLTTLIQQASPLQMLGITV